MKLIDKLEQTPSFKRKYADIIDYPITVEQVIDKLNQLISSHNELIKIIDRKEGGKIPSKEFMAGLDRLKKLWEHKDKKDKQ